MLLWVPVFLSGQDKKAARFAKTITQEDLRERLTVLASDSLEGRDTGSRGQKMAADYIAKHFESIGLEAPVEGSYFQKFPLVKGTWNKIYVRKGDVIKENLTDFLYYSRSETSGEEFIELAFLGENLEYNDGDLKGKYLVMTNKSWGAWDKNIEKLKRHNPAGFFIVSNDESEFEFALSRFQNYFSRPIIKPEIDRTGDKIIITSTKLISWIFEKSYTEISEGDQAKVIFNADMLVENIGSENVLGFLKGTDKPEELVVITSHFDHIGVSNGEIYNGADDDGSGTVTVMELAEAFTIATKKKNGPKRSILFMCVSGEEKGLLGSAYYTSNPVFPLENTVTNLNLDMVGRVDDKHLETPDYIYIIGPDKLSQDLHQLSERINENTVNLEFDYTYNDENDPNRFYYRSDHYNFAKNNIPIIFYFNGTHADYHKPTDTIEKINFEVMKKRADLIFYTAWEIANREERIKLD